MSVRVSGGSMILAGCHYKKHCLHHEGAEADELVSSRTPMGYTDSKNKKLAREVKNDVPKAKRYYKVRIASEANTNPKNSTSSVKQSSEK